jgi:hypothetical protein
MRKTEEEALILTLILLLASLYPAPLLSISCPLILLNPLPLPHHLLCITSLAVELVPLALCFICFSLSLSLSKNFLFSARTSISILFDWCGMHVCSCRCDPLAEEGRGYERIDRCGISMVGVPSMGLHSPLSSLQCHAPSPLHSLPLG